VAKGNTCSCFHPIWKLASRTMMAKVFWTASWVLVCSLPWAQCKMWIPIRSMGWVCTHQGRPTIEGCGSPSYIWSVMEKIREDKWRVGKIGWAISQVPAPGPKHDNIWAQWASNISSESMLKKVWWCKCFKMEF